LGCLLRKHEGGRRKRKEGRKGGKEEKERERERERERKERRENDANRVTGQRKEEREIGDSQ